jgi:hypothetical protein
VRRRRPLFLLSSVSGWRQRQQRREGLRAGVVYFSKRVVAHAACVTVYDNGGGGGYPPVPPFSIEAYSIITIFALGSTYNIHRITLIRTCVLSCSHNTLALDRIHNTDYCAVAPLVRVGVEPLVVPGIILYRTRTALYDSNSTHAVIQY